MSQSPDRDEPGGRTMRHITLPNGRRIAVISKFAARDVYEEIFDDNVYLREGLRIDPGDVVLDIGANVGLFSLFVLEQVPKLRLVAVEPIPQIFAALQENLEAHKPSDAEVTLLNVGLAENEGTAEFNFYPRLDSDSTRTPFDFERQVQSFLAMTETSIARLLPTHMRVWLIRTALRWFYAPQKIECRLQTLSQVIRELQLECIDYVKLDAENAEREVIAGLADGDWPKIRQMAIEVHTNIPGGEDLVEEFTALLRSRGFSVVVDLESRFSNVGVHMLYATRAVA